MGHFYSILKIFGDSYPSFQELDQNGEVLQLKHLAGELNGCGGIQGLEELKAPIGQVKNGHVEAGESGGFLYLGKVEVEILQKKHER